MESLKRPRETDSLSPRDSEDELTEKYHKYSQDDSIALDLSAKALCPAILDSDSISNLNKEDSPIINETEISAPVKEEWGSPWWSPYEVVVESEQAYPLSPHDENASPNPVNNSNIYNNYALNLVKEENVSHVNMDVSVAEVQIETTVDTINVANNTIDLIVGGAEENLIDDSAASVEDANKHCVDGSDDHTELPIEPNFALPSPVTPTLKKETDGDLEINNEIETIGAAEETITDSVIDVENECFVDLTGDDYNAADDEEDDDEIKIVSVEEPIMYLGSENRLPKKRRKHKRTYSFGTDVIDRIVNAEELSIGDAVAGTSSSTRGRVRSPILFRDLLDSTISIDEINDISSPETPPMSALARRIRGLEPQTVAPSLEQQVLSDLSDDPHSDEIAQELRDYEQTLRQASRTLYDIQGQEYTDTPSTPAACPNVSSNGLLLKHMFFPPTRFAAPSETTGSGSEARGRHAQHASSRTTRPSRMTCNPLLTQEEQARTRRAESLLTERLFDFPVVPISVPAVADPDVIMTAAMPSATAITGPSTSAPAKPAAPSNELACPICFEPLSELKKIGRNMCSTICGHMFCRNCLEESLRQCKQCPTCRKKLSKKQYHNIYLNFV